MSEIVTTEQKSTVKIPAVQIELEKSLTSIFGNQITCLDPLAWKEYGLTIGVSSSDLKSVMKALKEDARTAFDMLVDVTCVDWLDQKEKRFEIVYQLLSTTKLHRLCVKSFVDEAKSEIDSVRDIWASANFLEREVFDMFGVIFVGHGDLRRILMYDEFVGHPLRKDYPIHGKQPRIELRVPELRNTSYDMHRENLVAMPKKNKARTEIESGSGGKA